MNEIGIRELKAKASELVRHVAEDHAVYTITRRGRPVGVLAPAGYVAGKGGEAGREAWARLLAMADRMAKQPEPRKSALDALFKMRRERDDTLCGKPQYGYTESARHEPVGPRFVRITDIQDGLVDWDTVPYCQCDDREKYQLKTGDSFFARTGATTGKSYLVADPPESVFASYLIRIRPGNRVLPEFLWWFFQSGEYWRAVFSGTEDGNRPNMNGSKLAELDVPFPASKPTQRRIVARLDALAAKQSDLHRLQAETDADLAAFTPALLAKAFRGEL